MNSGWQIIKKGKRIFLMIKPLLSKVLAVWKEIKINLKMSLFIKRMVQESQIIFLYQKMISFKFLF